jgi:hypothetical protein
MTGSLRALGARALPRTLLLACAAFAGTGLLLTACSAASQNSEGTAASAPHAINGAGYRAAAPGSGNGPTYGTSNGKLATVVLPSQSIIYTAHLAVRAKDVAAAAAKATSIAIAAGGYVSNQQQTIPPGRHQVPEANLELKVPVAAYTTTLTKLTAQLGRRISFGQHAQDVTQQVADVNSRVASAQAAIKQLRALLSKAGSVGQLLLVQEEINNQESALEALLAQQRALAHETSYATVTAVLVGHHARLVAKHKKTSPGFLAGLRGGWHALVVVVGWLLTALGSALPFLIPVLLLAGIAIGGRRRLGRRKIPPAAEPPAPAAP